MQHPAARILYTNFHINPKLRLMREVIIIPVICYQNEKKLKWVENIQLVFCSRKKIKATQPQGEAKPKRLLVCLTKIPAKRIPSSPSRIPELPLLRVKKKQPEKVGCMKCLFL